MSVKHTITSIGIKILTYIRLCRSHAMLSAKYCTAVQVTLMILCLTIFDYVRRHMTRHEVHVLCFVLFYKFTLFCDLFILKLQNQNSSSFHCGLQCQQPQSSPKPLASSPCTSFGSVPSFHASGKTTDSVPFFTPSTYKTLK